jgi:hypothetical protein
MLLLAHPKRACRRFLCTLVLLVGCEAKAPPPPPAKAEPQVDAKAVAESEAKAAAEAAKAKEARVEELIGEALALIRVDAPAARKKLNEALALAPTHKTALKGLSLADGIIESTIAGNWRLDKEVDPMTDKETVSVFLLTKTREATAKIVARCKNGKLDAVVAFDKILDGSARVRYGTEPAKPLPYDESTDHETAFVRKPLAWLRELVAHHDTNALFEFQTFRGAPIMVDFDLAGADIAIEKVVTPCGGWPKPKKECNLPWPETCD